MRVTIIKRKQNQNYLYSFKFKLLAILQPFLLARNNSFSTYTLKVQSHANLIIRITTIPHATKTASKKEKENRGRIQYKTALLTRVRRAERNSQ